jgi:hypothetical protein
MNYEVQARSPKDLSTKEFETCVSIIREGCAVDANSAAQQLPKVVRLVVARAGPEIVGVGAIKMQRPDYALGVAKKSSFAFDRQMQELGYVAVLEAHQGNRLSGRIVQELLAGFQDPLWATTWNERMKRSLGRGGFVQQGKEWPSRKGKPLSLWIKTSKWPTTGKRRGPRDCGNFRGRVGCRWVSQRQAGHLRPVHPAEGRDRSYRRFPRTARRLKAASHALDWAISYVLC